MARPTSGAWRSAPGCSVSRAAGPAALSSIARSATRSCAGCTFVNHGAERLDGRPALVVERADGRYLVTSAGTGAGVLSGADRPPRRTAAGRAPAGDLRRAAEGGGARPRTQARGQGAAVRPGRDAADPAPALADRTGGDLRLRGPDRCWSRGVARPARSSGRPRPPGTTSSRGPLRLAEVAYAWERPELRVVPAAGLGVLASAALGISRRMSAMPSSIDFESVRRRLAAGEGGYEIIHTSPGLELGVYVLVAPEPDRQQPHADDEVYVVLEGRGDARDRGRGDRSHRRPGGVRAGRGRASLRRLENLSVLVIFAQPT